MFCAIWYHLYDLKNVKNTHAGVLLLVKLQALSCNFTKSNTPPWVLWSFINFTNDIKSCKASHICITITRGDLDLLSANHTKWSNTIKQFVDKLFECVWQFCGVGAYMVKSGQLIWVIRLVFQRLGSSVEKASIRHVM